MSGAAAAKAADGGIDPHLRGFMTERGGGREVQRRTGECPPVRTAFVMAPIRPARKSSALKQIALR